MVTVVLLYWRSSAGPFESCVHAVQPLGGKLKTFGVFDVKEWL